MTTVAPAFARALLARAGVVAPAATEDAPAVLQPAQAVVELPREAFAPDWPARPATTARIGLRLVSLKTTEYARGEASRIACLMHPELDRDERNWVDCFNDALMRVVLSKATCRPHDVSEPFWDVAEENIKLALTDDGVRALWERYEALRAEVDPLMRPATDDDLGRLADALRDAATWARLPAVEAARVRRLLRHALTRIEA